MRIALSVLGMLVVTLSCAVHYSVHTPRFTGTAIERYDKGLRYYQTKMGREDFKYYVEEVNVCPP